MQGQPFLSRRLLLRGASAGFAGLALSGLGGLSARSRAQDALAPKAPHFEPRAKRVIFLCMRGAPSHVDTFDYKPELVRDDGKSGRYGSGRLLASPWEFRQRGESGLWISDLFPNVGEHADELCLLRGMHCDQPNHPQALTQMHTGTFQFVRPSLGSWVLYGLGTENESVPGFLSINPPTGSTQNYGSAFLPAVYQGTKLNPGRQRRSFRRRRQPDVVPDIRNPRLSDAQQRAQLDFVQRLNEDKLKRDRKHPGVEGAIDSLELAYRMQSSMPSLMDLSGESDETLAMYGVDVDETDTFGRQCLLARRLVEAGVRFVEITHGNWDHHFRMSTDLPERAREVDLPIAGLLTDLKRRGLLRDTLVVWGGEFGRTPHAPGGNGRDHNHRGYTTWMAGGGVHGGFSYGATDEHGYEAVEGKVHIHDWHATILHLLGLDHESLTYPYAGRDFRLTDVHGRVVRDVLA
ncbi:MAG: DUF1501 domain-containing protein [Planctomycetota bacterium]